MFIKEIFKKYIVRLIEQQNLILRNEIKKELVFLRGEIAETNRQIIENYKKIFFFTLNKKRNRKEKEILNRFNYFLPNYYLEIIRDYKYLPRHIRLPLLIDASINLDFLNKNYSIYYFRSYNIDYENNPFEGWEWHSLLNDLNLATILEKIEISKNKLKEFIEELRKQKKDKVYVFGTGPSLEKALNMNFNDGYTIVCNSIVKDKYLFNKLNPDFFIATDAIFHFDNNRYADKFRKDLYKRFTENKKFKFIFGNIFYPIALRYFYEFRDRFIIIPMNSKQDFNDNLLENFYLPNQGNVLTLVLLPLAATISKNIYLFGFDGRSPNDKLFWKHSEKHSYDEYIKDIIKKHPAFFNYQVPENNPFKYTKENLENKLEKYLLFLEQKDFRIKMMHKSYIIALNKRV